MKNQIYKKAGKLILVILISCISSTIAKQKLKLDKEERPNILWIIGDDISRDLGCYGNNIVKTPNIDKLAKQGIRFNQAYTTSPVCSPSRSAFITGMYQTSIGVHQHDTPNKEPLPANVKTLMDYFRSAGYFTSNTDGGWVTPGKTHFNFKDDKPFDGTDWRQRKAGQPFYAQVNFHEPHRKFSRDPKNPINPDKIKLPSYYPDYPLSRRDWADYLESIQILDQKVGMVLERLEKDGLAKNTIVVFMGDHGRAHVRDKQFLYDGGIGIPLIIRWPEHLKAGTVNNELISAIDLVPTSLDLAGILVPEHLQGKVFLGSKIERREYIVAARDRCDETFDRIRCIRTKKFKYIRNFHPEFPYKQSNLYKQHSYPVRTLMEVLFAEGKLTPEQAHFMAPARPAEELYDLEYDPEEVYNLAGKEEHKFTLIKMRSILNAWIKETKDQGEIEESREVSTQQYTEKLLPHFKPLMDLRGITMDTSPSEYLKFWENRLLTPMSADAFNKIVLNEDKAWNLKKTQK